MGFRSRLYANFALNRLAFFGRCALVDVARRAMKKTGSVDHFEWIWSCATFFGHSHRKKSDQSWAPTHDQHHTPYTLQLCDGNQSSSINYNKIMAKLNKFAVDSDKLRHLICKFFSPFAELTRSRWWWWRRLDIIVLRSFLLRCFASRRSTLCLMARGWFKCHVCPSTFFPLLRSIAFTADNCLMPRSLFCPSLKSRPERSLMNKTS